MSAIVLAFCWRVLWTVSLGFLIAAAPGAGAAAPVYKIQDPFITQSPYRSQDPDTLGNRESRAFGVNEFGILAGEAGTPDGRLRAFRWREDPFVETLPVDLGPAGGTSVGAAVGRTGLVAGYLTTVVRSGNSLVNLDRGFRGTEHTGLQDSGTLGGTQSQAYGINAAGQVIGSALTAGNLAWHAFRMTNGHRIDLGTLGGAASAGYGINAAGEVVGGANTALGFWHAFFWRDANGNGRADPGEMGDLGTFGGSNSEADGINAAGLAVGAADTPAGVGHAFRAPVTRSLNPATDDLGTLGGPRSKAFAINASAQVVGTAQTSTAAWHAFVFLDGLGMIDLNSRIDAPLEEKPEDRWVLVEARSINDAGQIAGWGLHKGKRRAFLLTPVGAPLPVPSGDVDLPERNVVPPPSGVTTVVPIPRLETPRDRIAVFRRKEAQWLIQNYDGSATVAQFGDGDPTEWRLIPADYLGTGTDQIAIFKPSTQEWLIRREDGGRVGPAQFGWESGDIPVPGDYLGLGRAQLAIYRPDGEWRVRRNDGSWITVAPLTGTADPTDVPVPAAYVGFGRVQMAVFRRATGDWYLRSDDGTVRPPIQFGQPGDIPVPGYYHYGDLGSAGAQLAVFRPDTGQWLIGTVSGTELDRTQLGRPGDVPVPGAYSGNTLGGKYVLDIAVFRPITREWIYLPPNRWWAGRFGEEAAVHIPWGGPEDTPAPGAYPFKLGV